MLLAINDEVLQHLPMFNGPLSARKILCLIAFKTELSICISPQVHPTMPGYVIERGKRWIQRTNMLMDSIIDESDPTCQGYMKEFRDSYEKRIRDAQGQGGNCNHHFYSKVMI